MAVSDPEIRFRCVEFIRGEIILQACKNLYGFFVLAVIGKNHPLGIE